MAQGSHWTGCPSFGRIVLASSAKLRHGRVARFSWGNANRGDGSLAGRSFKSQCALFLCPPATTTGAPLAKSWNEGHVDHSPMPLTVDTKCEQEVNMYGRNPLKNPGHLRQVISAQACPTHLVIAPGRETRPQASVFLCRARRGAFQPRQHSARGRGPVIQHRAQ